MVCFLGYTLDSEQWGMENLLANSFFGAGVLPFISALWKPLFEEKNLI